MDKETQIIIAESLEGLPEDLLEPKATETDIFKFEEKFEGKFENVVEEKGGVERWDESIPR